MCNLNVVIKKPGIDVTERLANASAVSYASNSDADGIYLNAGDIVKRSDNKLNLRKLKDAIVKSTFILSHQRISTSGKMAKFHHPFVNERWALIHNGIFSEVPSGKSDTAHFFENFNKRFEELGEVKAAVNKALEDSRGGSFSVFIYDKLNQKGYYFKNYGPQIHGVKLNDGTMFLTTNSSNLVYFKAKWELDIEALELYEFQIEEDGPQFYKMGPIDDPKTASTGYWDKRNREYDDYRGYHGICEYSHDDKKYDSIVPEKDEKKEPDPNTPPLLDEEAKYPDLPPPMSDCLHIVTYPWKGLIFCKDCGLPVENKEDYDKDGELAKPTRLDEYS